MNSGAAALSLEIVGMTKHFGSVRALSDVSLRIEAGGFHALLGENGAGKSTLVKCLIGFYSADEGQVVVDGREVAIRTPREASQIGIGMVYQNFTLAPSMTIAENLVIARGALPKFLNWKEEYNKLSEFMNTIRFTLPLDKPAGALSAGEKQKVEIAKQLYLKRRFMILDEPTSVLTIREADEILGLLKELTRKKLLTVLMITHKFREVTAYADNVSILRRGCLSGNGRIPDLSVEQMARMMIGSTVTRENFDRRALAEPVRGKPRLTVSNLSAIGDHGLPALNGVNLTVCSGEILGIAGVSGNGQKELVEVLLGQREKSSGVVAVNGAPYSGKRSELQTHKIFSLPEEPLRNACIPRQSIAYNLAIRNYDKPPLSRFGWINYRALRDQAERYVSEFRVKTNGIGAAMQTLSGGNVQRAVLARELSNPVDLFIVSNPFFGLDFNATSEIRARLQIARENGTAILLVCEDIDEFLELADRIMVMSEGKIVFETRAKDVDVPMLGHYMAGGHALQGAEQ